MSSVSARVGDGPGVSASEVAVELEERRELVWAVRAFLEVLGEGAPGEWAAQAACRGRGPGEFFPGEGESTQHGRRVCAGCEVQAECQGWAFELGPEQVGIAGGLNEAQRAALAPASPAEPGARAWCAACRRPVEGVGGDRLRSGYCSACFVAWRRAGRPERASFELRRRNRSEAA